SQCDDTTPPRVRRDGRTAVTDIRIGEFETGLFVVLLLRRHAIEPDHPCTSVGEGCIPHVESIAAAANIISHYVKAEEGEARAVIDARDRRGRSAFEFTNEETIRIYRRKAVGVGEARIPSFGSRPVHGD